jgi:hypothetical protein
LLVEGRSTPVDTADAGNGRLPDVAVKIINEPEDVAVISETLVHERVDVFKPIIGSSLVAEDRNPFRPNLFYPKVEDVIVELAEVGSCWPWQCLDFKSHFDQPGDEFFFREHWQQQIHAKKHVCSGV